MFNNITRVSQPSLQDPHPHPNAIAHCTASRMRFPIACGMPRSRQGRDIVFACFLRHSLPGTYSFFGLTVANLTQLSNHDFCMKDEDEL